ncbi:hypothetical protein HZC00_01640 [Candidatus Kaiserbacteria bacterium]|nr:hypothetical protein [Candidatus Kaiserbacteria bacterium]
MKLTFVAYFSDGTSKIVEFEKPPGAHPESVSAAMAALEVAETTGKRVDRIGRSNINPSSKPPGPLEVNENLTTRGDLLERFKTDAPQRYEEYLRRVGG